MTIYGVGPIIGVITAGYFLAALAAHYVADDLFVIRRVPYVAFLVAGVVLTGAGLPMFIVSARAARRAFRKGRLLTQGAYAICRHPVYASLLVCVCGIVLFFHSWLLLTVPLVTYAAARVFLKREEDYLEQRFGHEYVAYRQKVNPLFPTLRR